MINSRDMMLTAVRKAVPGKDGLLIGPLSFVGGRNLRLRRVTTDDMKRRLLTRIKLAPSASFKSGVIWEFPDVRKKQAGKSRPR